MRGSVVDEAPTEAVYPTDESLMHAIQEGHIDLLGVLYERYSRRVSARCHGMVGDPADVDDLVQETFLRVLRYRSGFRGDARFSTWLYRIASNVCLDHMKARGKRAASNSDLASVTSIGNGPSAHRERLAVLETALDRLPADKRELLLLCRLGGLSYTQLAERLGAREGTVRVRVHRAVTQLKSIFDTLWEGGS